MPYGTPTPNENAATWSARFDHPNGVPVYVTTDRAGFFDLGDVDDAFQAVVDVFDASSFTQIGATKSYPTAEDATPTP